MEFPKGPIHLKVKPRVETNRVVVSGPGAVPTPKGVPCSIPTEFLIDTREAGLGDVQVQVLSPDNTPRKVKVQDGGDGTFRTTYDPDDCGRYNVCVRYGGHEVPDSPFFVQPHSTGSAEKSTITERRNQNLRSGEKYAHIEEKKERSAELETKPNSPLHNLYLIKIKEEVIDPDPDPPFFSLTSVVKLESDFGQLDTQYFDHSSVIQENLKTESDDEERNCEDPLNGADSMPLGETPEKYLQVGQFPIEKVQLGEHSFSCLLCNQSFSLKGSELQMTCEKCFPVGSNPNEPKVSSNVDKKKPFKCETCGKKFVTWIGLSYHRKTHTGEVSFKCKTCGECFGLSSHLTAHRKTHTVEKRFKCEICGKCFGRNSYLTAHGRMHSGVKPLKCETCGKCFAEKSTLYSHIRIHSGVKPYQCGTCGKCFTQRSNLKSHMRTHSGVKGFQCESCGKSFANKSTLIVHKRSHTGEKPYMCEKCGKCFVDNKHLTRHKVCHTGE